MTNKLVVVINRLKYQKWRKCYHMKWNFLYQITAASRTPDWGATAPRSPFSLSSVPNWICWTPPPPKKNSWVRHWIHLFVTATVYSLDYMMWFPENIKCPRSLNFRFIDSAPQQSLVCIFRPHVHSTPDSADVSRPFLTDLVHANCLV